MCTVEKLSVHIITALSQEEARNSRRSDESFSEPETLMDHTEACNTQAELMSQRGVTGNNTVEEITILEKSDVVRHTAITTDQNILLKPTPNLCAETSGIEKNSTRTTSTKLPTAGMVSGGFGCAPHAPYCPATVVEIREVGSPSIGDDGVAGRRMAPTDSVDSQHFADVEIAEKRLRSRNSLSDVGTKTLQKVALNYPTIVVELAPTKRVSKSKCSMPKERRHWLVPAGNGVSAQAGEVVPMEVSHASCPDATSKIDASVPAFSFGNSTCDNTEDADTTVIVQLISDDEIATPDINEEGEKERVADAPGSFGWETDISGSFDWETDISEGVADLLSGSDFQTDVYKAGGSFTTSSSDSDSGIIAKKMDHPPACDNHNAKWKKRSTKFEVIEGVSLRGSDKLFDDDGYTYGRKRSKPGSCVWRCSVRTKTKLCGATVLQSGQRFRKGPNEHNHPPMPNSRTTALVATEAKKMAEMFPTKASKLIVQDVIEKYFCEGAKHLDERIIYNFVQSVNIHKRRLGIRQRPHQTKNNGGNKSVGGRPKGVSSLRHRRIKTSGTVEGEHNPTRKSGSVKVSTRRPVGVATSETVIGHGVGVQRDNPSCAYACNSFEKFMCHACGRITKMPHTDLDAAELEIVGGVSLRGYGKLFDRDGFSYCMYDKSLASGTKTWRCSQRKRIDPCGVTIMQHTNGLFCKNSREHNHLPKTNAKLSALLAAETKREALVDVTKPGYLVVDELLQRHLGDTAKEYDQQRRLGLMHIVGTIRKNIGIPPAQSGPSVFYEIDSSTVRIMRGVSIRGADRLFTDDGHVYLCKKKNVDGSTRWGCTMRTHRNYCPAVIRHTREGRFERGIRLHNHPPNPKAELATLVAAETRQSLAMNPTKHVPDIVRDVLERHSGEGALDGDAKQVKENLKHNLRGYRRKLCAEPVDVAFEFDRKCVPVDFMRKDISLPGLRHMIFATDKQLQCLQKADVWYIHTTNKVVKKPFQQLLSIQAFVRREKRIEQLPLLFCTMSRMRKTDYVTVLQEVLELFAITPSVERFVADFDQALWKACKRVLPSVEVRGCARLYREAILKHISDIGLERKYLRDTSDAKIMKKLMALCFLPPGRIPKVFRKLKKSSPASKNDLRCLFRHIKDRWLKNKTWHPRSWSVFNNPFRTEENIKGWVTKLGEGETPQRHSFYPLLQVLHNSSVMTIMDCEIKSVSNKKLLKHQKKLPGSLQKRIFQYWDQYTEKKRTVEKLLHACVKVNDPDP